VSDFTIVVPFYNGHATLDRLIRSLPRKFPLIIVDDMSEDPLKQEDVDKRWEHQDGNDIKVIRLDRKGYFAGAVNRGIKEAGGDVLVLNQDIWFDDLNFLEVIRLARKHYAFFGERIRGDHPAFGKLGYVHGTFMFISNAAVRSVGYLNEKTYPLWGNTAEYQWRVARAGMNVLPIPDIPGMHHERKETERYGSGIRELLDREPEKRDVFIRTPPLLSVVVPCFNYGRYLEDCIASLIGGRSSLGRMEPQTLQSFEVIIVDDCSTDNSEEYIKALVSEAKGIKGFRLETNVGTAQALNFGIQRAVGKYITFLSADDMRENFSLEHLVQACEDNPHSFAYDDIQMFNRNQRTRPWPMEEYDFEKLIYKNHIHAGIVFPRAAWQEVGGYPAIMGDGREDWAFNVALGLKGWCGVHVRERGYLYRREGQNRTEVNGTEGHRIKFLEKIMGLFPALYRGERPMGCCGSSSRNRAAVVNHAKTALFSTGGMKTMSNQVGAMGMERIEYQGEQVDATWTGDFTGATYVFGKDRPRGWVDKRDLGSKDDPQKRGFLAKKDKYTGKYLFVVVGSNGEATQPPAEPVGDVVPSTEPEPEPVVVSEPVTSAVVAQPMTASAATTSATATGIVSTAEPIFNPENMTVEQVKAELEKSGYTYEQVNGVYKSEMANRNRKGLVSYLEEKLANWVI